MRCTACGFVEDRRFAIGHVCNDSAALEPDSTVDADGTSHAAWLLALSGWTVAFIVGVIVLVVR